MDTEAEIPESIISVTKREGEIVYSASGGRFDSTVVDTSTGELKKFQGAFSVLPETVKYSAETKNSQAANDVGAEAMNTVIEVNVETPEGEHFSGSPSAVPVAIEDTRGVSKNSEPEQVTLQAGNEMLESDRQVEVTRETATEENKATEESDEKPEKNNMSHDIGNLTGTSLLMANTEESNLMSKQEYLEESIIENKEAEKSINLMKEEPEATKPSERVADEDDKEKSMHGGAEETFTSTTDIKSDDEATLKIREEAGYEPDEKLQEVSGISYDEKCQDKIEASKKIECMTPVEDEMNQKNDMDTESLKVGPKIWSDGIILESPDEVKEQIEMSEKIAESDSTSNETGKEYERPEQKGEDSFMKHEGTLSANEPLPAKEASSDENRYDEESSVKGTKDNIAETEIINTLEHKRSGRTNSEERPENLQQNELGKEKLEGSLNAVAEDFNTAAEIITSVKQETPIKIQEKSIEEEIKKDLPKQTETNVSLIELNEKTECGEGEVPNKKVNDLHVTHALVEEAGQNEGNNLDEIFNSEPEGKIQEASEAYTKVEKQLEDAPEACPSANSTILEQKSIEGAETIELIPKASETDIEELQEASGPDFEEKSAMVDDEENTNQEIQKKGEACETVTEEILANCTNAGKCAIDAEASDEVNDAAAREEKVEQNIQVESPPEAAPELTGQDERCIAEDNNNRNNIINEEEPDGTKVAATVVAINEQVIEDNVTQISPESTDKQNVESCEGNKNVEENSGGENNREEVTEDSNIRCLLPESVEQVPINDLKYEKKEAEVSTEEILENSDTAVAAESITHETIKTVESPKDIFDNTTVQQGESLQSEERNLTPMETSPEETRNVATSPAIVVEENGGDSKAVAAEDNIETKIAESEEDLKHILQRNEPGEELPPSLSVSSNKEVFNSDADKTPGDVEEGPTQNLKEALQKEENEKETEVITDTYSKTSTEELYQDSNDGGKDEETEKHNIKEECSTTNILQEPIGEEPLQSSKEEKVDQYIELDEEEIKQSSQGDESKQNNDTYISPVLIEQETHENSEGNKNKAAITGGEHDREQMVEETNSRGLAPESVEQSPVKNLDDSKIKEDESTGEITENSKTSEVAESATHESSTTIGSTTEILDTSLRKQRESLENEEKNQTATEFSAQERRNKDGCIVILAEENSNDNELLGAKDNIEKEPSISEEDLQHNLLEKEPEEKHERSISAMSNENEAFSSNADKIPCLTEEGTSQDFDEASQQEDNDKGTEEKNDTEDNNIAAEENLEIVAESSYPSKITYEGMVLEPKLEEDRMLAQDEIKKDESEELYEDSKNVDEPESKKHKIHKEFSTTKILFEPTEEKTQQSFEEEGNDEETPKPEVCLELETTSVGKDAAEKQNEEGTSQDLDEGPQREDNNKETKEKNDTEVNKITTEENIEIFGEPHGASKSKETTVLELKSEKDKILAQDEIKNEEFIELHGDSKEASKSESEKHNTLEECGATNILLEPSADETYQNFEEEAKEEETIKTEACLELETTGAGEDAAEKQISEVENTVELSREVEVEKVEKYSKENDMAEKTYKEEECKTTQIDNSDDDAGRQSIEKGGADENKFELLARGTNNEDSLVKENEEKEHDKQAFKAEASSTGIEKQDIVQVELLKDQVEEEIVEENTKEDEITALKLEYQVNDSNSFTEETEATSSVEETVPETLKELAESNVNSNPLDGMKQSEEETPTIETSGGLIEESAAVPHMSNKETEKEIEGKEETTIDDSESVSITLVPEEKGLWEAEPEDKKQIERVCSASEEKGLAVIEPKETNLASLDVSVKPKDTSDVGEKKENKISTVVDKAGETNDGLIEESAMMSHTPNKETEDAIIEKGETSIEDSDSVPITVVTEAKGLQEAEPEDKEQVESVGPAFEEKGVAEIETEVKTHESEDNNVEPEVTSDLGERRDNEIPTVADTVTETKAGLIKESAAVSRGSNKETEEEIKGKEETSIEDSDSASVIVVTEAKGLQEAEPEDKEQLETVSPAFEDKGVAEIETKVTTHESVDNNVEPEVTSDWEEKRENEIPTVAETATDTNEGPIEESAMVTHASNEETEEEIKGKEETSIEDSDSASIIVVTEAKGSREAEPEDKEQLETVGPAFEEKCITEIETKETTLENVDISVKPEDTTGLDKMDNENSAVTDKVGETNEGLIEESSMMSHTQDKETEEEIKEKEETTVDDSNFGSIAAVTEAKGSQEAEPEDKKQVEIVGRHIEDRGMAETETKEITLKSVEINVKAKDTSDLGEQRDKEIPNMADEARETIDSEIQNEVPDAGSEDQTEVTTVDKYLDDLMEYSTITSKEHKPTTTEVSDKVNYTPAQDQAPSFENTESTCIAKEIDEMPMNKHDITNPVNVPELETTDVGKKTATEEFQKQNVEPENTENFSKSEDVEISKGEETGKLADQGNVCKSTTLNDVGSLNLGLQTEKTEYEKPLDETLKTIEPSGERTESEKSILEEEISTGNLKEVEFESAEIGPEGEAHFQRHEDLSKADDGSATEEKLECTTETVADNQTSETLPESHKIQMEEYSSDNQNKENDKEMKEKEDSQLEAEQHEEQNANKTTKAVILTEQEREGVEQSDDSEDIKKLVVEEEPGINEFHASSTVDETTDEMENSTPVSSEYDKAVDSNEQMKVENSEIEEDSTRETETSLARESEEQKLQDINIEPDSKESKEKIGDTTEESPDGYKKIDDAILTAKTETSFGEAELGDKLQKDFHVEATEAENSQQVKEVDNVKLEESSELAAELALNKYGHADRESITVENIDLSEPEESKIASETVSESKDLATEEAIVRKSQTMEKPDQIPTNNDDNAGRENAALENSGADEAEETQIISNAVDETKDLGVEETAEAVKCLTTENIDQIPSSDCEHTQKEGVAVENPKTVEVDEIKFVSNATFESKNQETEESFSEISTVENREAGETEETKIASEAVFESKVQGEEEAEVGKSQKVETPDQKLTNNDDNTDRENASMENSGADEFETKIVDEIKVVSNTVYKSKGQGAEEAEFGESQTVEKLDQAPTDDDDLAERKNEARENSGADEVEQVKTVSDAVDEAKDQGTGETAETGKSQTDQIPISNFEHAHKESVAMENPKADVVNEIKVVSDATYESNDTEDYAEQIPTVEKLDQTSAANSEQVEEDRVIMQYQDVEKVKDQIIEDIDEAGKDSTERNLDANKIEEASKAASAVEPVTENQVIADQTPSEEKLNVQFPTPTSTLPFKDETITTVEKIEEEKLQVVKLEDEALEDSSAAKPTEKTSLQTGSREIEVSTQGFNINKDVQDSSTKVYEEEDQNPEETIATVEKIEEEKPQVEKLEDEVIEDASAAKPTEETCLLTGSRELEVSTQGFNVNKNLQDSSTEVYEEEYQNPDEALKLEPRQNENKIKCADYSSETDRSKGNTDLAGPTEKAFILESETETGDKALQSEATIPSHEKPTESEDTEIRDKNFEVISDVRTEEVQFKKTSESNEITENEVSKEEIIVEKEAAKTCQPISLSEEMLNKSLHGDDGLKHEECRGDQTNDPFKTTVDGIQYEEPSVETEESTASTNISEQVAAEDTSVDGPDQVSVENNTINKSFPHGFEGKNVQDSAIQMGTENLGEESNLGSGKTEVTTPRDEESSVEISKKETIKQVAEEGELIQETQESKESSCEKTKMPIPIKAELIQPPQTIFQTDNEYDPPLLLEGITETPQKAQAGDLKPGNATRVLSEAEVKHEGEQRTDCSGEETNEGTLMVDSSKASLSDLFQRSRKETTQVAKQVNKETESTATIEENQTVKPETIKVKEAKVDEEKEEEDGHEHNKTDSATFDAPVIVEASKDMDVKAVHKKSHNILSGVGSKVKHSISRVKKVITGKSSHSK